MSGIYEISLNGKFFKTFRANNMKDAREYAKIDAECFVNHGQKLKVKQIAVCVDEYTSVYFKDLVINTEKHVKSLKTATLKALKVKDFSNDNTTFWLWQRGLMTEEREQLTESGKELYRLLNK